MLPEQTLFHVPYRSWLAFGVGGLGGRVASSGCAEGFAERLPWAACDSRMARLLSTGLDQKVCCELAPEGHAAQARPSVEARLQELRELARGRSGVLLFGALGQQTPSRLLPELCQFFRQEDLATLALGADALCCEDPRRQAASLQTRRLLHQAADLFIRLPASLRPPPTQAAHPAAADRRALEGRLLAAVQALLGALLGTPGLPSFRVQELFGALGGVGEVCGWTGLGQGPQALAEALNESLAAARGALESAARGVRVAVALCGGQPPGTGMLERLRAQLAALGTAGTQALLGLGVDGSLSSEARCLLLLRMAGSGKVVSITQGEQG